MPISVPPRGLGDALASRQARPLNGKEVADAILNHLLALTNRLLNNSLLLSNEILPLLDEIQSWARQELSRQHRLQKVHISYPKVGWNMTVRLEQYESTPPMEKENYSVNAEVDLDLERNVRLHLQFGESGRGKVIKSLEEEKIPNNVPDQDRRSYGLPIQVDHLKADGTVGKMDLNDIKPPEKRSARTVDVGAGRVEGQEVSQGETIVLPSELPEITLEMEDIVASPPIIPTEPPKVPLPPKNTMSGVTRPSVKFKK